MSHCGSHQTFHRTMTLLHTEDSLISKCFSFEMNYTSLFSLKHIYIHTHIHTYTSVSVFVIFLHQVKMFNLDIIYENTITIKVCADGQYQSYRSNSIGIMFSDKKIFWLKFRKQWRRQKFLYGRYNYIIKRESTN